MVIIIFTISKLQKLCLAIVIILNINYIPSNTLANNSKCNFKSDVCSWLDKVVAIKTPTMVASGIILSDEVIVTNRHVVEDSKAVLIRMPNKKIIKVFSIPNSHVADIVFLTTKEKNSQIKINFTDSKPEKVRMVAFDIGRNDIRIFPETNVISYPDNNNLQARIHSSAQNLPGTSGGALIDQNGNLIGVVASGGGEYNEAVPVNLLQDIYNKNNIDNQNFYTIGKSMRLCADALDEIQSYQNLPPKTLIRTIQTNCEISNNKLLFDMAGQAFGRLGLLNDSLYFLEKSSKLDPQSPTSLHSLAITLHLLKSYDKEVEVLKKLLQFTPDDPQALRLAVQAAGFSNNKEFGDYAISLMEIHNPGAVSLAKGFLESALNQSNK